VTTIAGTACSQGVELLAQGRITPAWRVLAGYTLLDASIVASPNADVGAGRSIHLTLSVKR